MGGGASIAKYDADISKLVMNKPADAMDIQDIAAARSEIIEWRRVANSLLKDHKIDLKGAVNKKRGGKRQAVMATKDEIPDDYVRPVVPKVDAVKELIFAAARENILFKSCQDDDWEDFVNAFVFMKAASGETVISQGDEGNLFFIVEEGSLDVFIKAGGGGDMKVGTLSSGSAFGELALMYNQPRAATIRAATECKLWVIDRNTFKCIKTINQKKRIDEHVQFLSKVTIGTSMLGEAMSRQELMKVASVMGYERFKSGEYIIRQDEMGDHFYIVLSGEVDIFKYTGTEKPPGNKLVTIGKGTFFGEKALLSEDKRAASCVAATNVKCLVLDREDFIVMFGNMDQFMSQRKNHAQKGQDESKVGDTTTIANRIDISREELEDVAVIGCGAFGRVILVKSKKDGATYALKTQGKKAIVENGLQEHILNERNVMCMLDHPFIIRLYNTMYDDKYIYFLLELLLGGEIFTHLRKLGSFEESWARFYAASVLAAFHCIHNKAIAYRDLKPENLVLDYQGYCKLVDFGLAKKVTEGKAWTLCGTPDYLAPEIILNEGHNTGVDYWALGVLIYEMVCGVPPFYAEEAMEIYERILNGTVPIPSSFSKSLGDIIRKLLKQQQTKRLGVTKDGTMGVMKHKWYSGFDWQSLVHRKLKAPIDPKVSNDTDHSNFDEFDLGDDNVEPCPEWCPNF